MTSGSISRMSTSVEDGWRRV